jgi:hypothetical protein
MKKIDHLRSLTQLCRHFNGRLAVIEQPHFDRLFEDAKSSDWDGVCESPFTCAHGIHWQRKIVYAVQGREEIGSIIHEMGHVFADPHHPESDKCREWSWFGWEIAVARLIGAGRVWSRQNSNYATDEKGGNEWGALSAKKRRAVVIERLVHAKKIGVVDSDGTPRSIR